MDPAPENFLPTILVIDDRPDETALLSLVLRDRYRVKVANSGKRGLQVARNGKPPDLILLDIMMPNTDGYAVCRRLKMAELTRDIPIIFLTARSDKEEEKHGLELGAVDYITKPLNFPIVCARLDMHLRLKAAGDLLKEKNAILEAEVARRTSELHALQDVTVFALASLAESRNNETGNHIRRTQHYVKLLARQLQSHSRFADVLPDQVVELLFKSAPLHDIGKVGIPDSILLKAGPLTADEFEVMKSHTTIGRDALERAEAALGVPVEFLRFAKEMAYSHQEKWDGSGYPLGLQGEDIPVSARLMSIADVYDALISRRVYKPPMSHAEAVSIIVAGRDTHFDPAMVDAFNQISEEFRKISAQFRDQTVQES